MIALPPPGAPLPHAVSEQPFDPVAEAEPRPGGALAEASQLRVMWWKFRRHRVAVLSAGFLLLIYLVAALAEFIAPYDLHSRDIASIHAPPQRIHLFHEGRLVGPFVYPRSMTLDLDHLRRVYAEDRSRPQRLRWLCAGDPYLAWGALPGRRHLFCPPEGGTAYLLGTDRLGRDILSRIIHGARISLTIGLLGVTTSLVLGIVLGGVAGYYGGWVDAVVQRLTEVLQSIPSIPLWMALAAIMPLSWSPLLVYAGITVILGLLDWTGLARAVRSKLMALREEDYVQAARILGASPRRIIARHLVPGFASHLLASATLTVPGMILGETALSFLGLGLRAPVTSWGTLLTEARNVNALALHPWLLFPVLPVVLVVLAFNFLGDGLRDAADPLR